MKKSAATSSPDSRPQSHWTPVGLYGDEVTRAHSLWHYDNKVQAAIQKIWANIPSESNMYYYVLCRIYNYP